MGRCTGGKMNINIRLNKNFTTAFNKMQEAFGEELSKINGFADGQLSYTDFIDNFVDTETVADASVDGNANVGQKDIVTLINEMPKPHQKLLAFNKIYYEINKKYGFKTANKWLEKEWDGHLYLHDANTASFLPYCYAYDLKDLAEKGLFFIENFNSEPPKHLSTFVDFIKEFVSYACNRSSGAVGLPNLIPYMYYFWDRDVKQNYYTVSPEKYAEQQIQRLIYALNQPFLRGGIQSAFTNTSIFDHPYLEALFGGSEFPDGKFMIDEIEGIMEFQKIYLTTMSKIRAKNMMTFPVNTICLLKQNGKFVDEDFAIYAIKHNMKWNDSNIFADSSVNSLSNCCRLKNNIEDLGYFNSIGGTALKVGSVKVSTINLARLALENHTEKDYLVALKDIVELNLMVLDRVRHIIKRNVEKGLLKNFSLGLVDFKYLYNTIGFIGIYETMKTFGYTRKDEFGNTFYTEEAERFGKKIFEVIHNVKNTFVLDKDYMVNIEQIPGETAAVKLMQKDKFFFGEAVVDDLPLYGNQFIPLGIKTTLQERIRIAALFDGFCNGGSILHVNVETPFKTFEQAWDMLNYITDQGVTYFAFNTKIQSCKHNHAFFGKVCPDCGEPVYAEYSRIVGFYVPITITGSKERKAEYKMREWEPNE
jgi:anaerobic ribonucleoside-triphosphate reductase